MTDQELVEALKTVEGQPNWSALSRETGATRQRLQRVYQAMQRGDLGQRPQPAPSPQPPPPPEPDEPEELTQLRAAYSEACDVIAVMLSQQNVSQYATTARYRDELAAKVRQVKAALSRKSEPSEEEVIEGVEHAATHMPAEHAEIMIEIFKRRMLL